MPSVTVLMATFNGRKYVTQQLSSILNQSWGPPDIIISDDGSTDGTRDLLQDFAPRWKEGRFVMLNGPARGQAAANFAHLFLALPEDADGVALADQDDVWHAEKLASAMAALAPVPPGVPAVACSRTRLVDSDGMPFGLSRYFRHRPCFPNALVQSIAGGNTMVLNRPAVALVRESFRRGIAVPAHDWWIYMLVTGAGGQMLYRPQWDTDYRQHGGNVVGDNQGLAAAFRRLLALRQGHYRRWIEANLLALRQCADLLTPQAQATMALVDKCRSPDLRVRLRAMARRPVYRQTVPGNIALYGAMLLGLF